MPSRGDFAASLELADNHEMVEFVCALEPEAVFLAAQKVDEEGLVKLEELMIACEEAMGNSKESGGYELSVSRLHQRIGKE